MPNSPSALAANPDPSHADPSLAVLIAGSVMVVLLSAYWLYDTYFLREAVPQTLKSGKTYVARFHESRRPLPPLRAGGEQLVQTIDRAKALAVALKQDIATATADLATREDKHQSELAAIKQQSAQAERLIAELMTEIEGLPRSALAGTGVQPSASTNR
jgi:hypothetical protein